MFAHIHLSLVFKKLLKFYYEIRDMGLKLNVVTLLCNLNSMKRQWRFPGYVENSL